MITTNLSPEVYARALKVAQSLKAQLEERLIGQGSAGISCGCGACSYGTSKVRGIDIPMSYQYQIAMWSMWTCDMQDHRGKRWGVGITKYVSWAELYPMFRNAFAGIDVRVEHPFAQVYDDLPHPFFGDLAAKNGRIFTASGRRLNASDAAPAYVRPIGDVTQSAWVNAELRVDSNMPDYAAKTLIACNVDPMHFGSFCGRGNGRYYNAINPADLPTFYIRVPGSGCTKERFLPVARLVDFDETTSSGTFELDQSVEAFEAAGPAE